MGIYWLYPLFSLVTISATEINYYYDFQVETTRHCIAGIRDANGKPPACSYSVAMETAGLTLPGMENGYLTTRSHIIIASDGSETAIKAHPSHPYQYIMSTMTEDSITLEQLMNGQAHFIGRAPPRSDITPTTLSGFESLEEFGWTFQGSTDRDGVVVNKWVKEGLEGTDNATGANMAGIYMANLAPDTWTLLMDGENERPLKIISTNRRHDDVIHQRITFTKFEKKEGHLSWKGARQLIHDMYAITDDKARPMMLDGDIQDSNDDTFSNFRESLLAGHIPSDACLPTEVKDWMPHRHLRSSNMIPYFTIEEGSAAATYFNRKSPEVRRLMTLFQFQYPSSCDNSTNKDEFCIFVNAAGSGFEASFSLSVGIRLPDVVKPGRVAQLALAFSISLTPDNHNLVLDLTLKASGCAIIWQEGEGISLSITVCLAAKGGVHYSNHSLSFSASVGASVSFDVDLPVIGSIIDFTISGELGVTAAPNNTITVYGQIGVSHSILIAGASIYLDIVAATADHLPNKWQFSSGVTLSAWVNLIFWRPRWGHRYVIWSVGPVLF